jgi:hypothetical protein
MHQYGENIYMHISSQDSKEYFPNNKLEHFHVKLDRPLNLQGSWAVGLCEIHLSRRVVKKVKDLVVVDDGRGNDNDVADEPDIVNLRVECSLCMGLIVHGVQTRTLRTLTAKASLYKVFPIIYYFPVETRFIDTVEFRILNTSGELATFNEVGDRLEMVLHLKIC